MSKQFIIESVKSELISQGLSQSSAMSFAIKAGDYFERIVCNSKDPFKDFCDYAGDLASKSVSGFKYKSPKAKSRARAKKPQEAFNFGQ